MMFRKTYIVVALLLIIIAGFIYAYREFNRRNLNVAQESSVYRVDADELIREFTANDSVANARYVGRILSVNGLVKDISKDERSYYTVILGDTAGSSSIRCAIDSIYSGTASAIKPGTSVTVKGTCTGYNEDELLGFDIFFNRCLIEDHN